MSATGIAHAQSIAPPPIRSNVDQNGVDVTTGAFNASTPTISIGQPGNGGLAYGRYYDSVSDAWRDNTASGINYDSSSGEYTVTLFGSSRKFIFAFGQFSPVELWGGTLSFNSGTQKYTYTTRDGAVAIFDKALATSQPLQANEGLPTTVTEPNGMVTTFTYTLLSGSGFSARRIQSLQTSFGYQLKFEYETSNADATGLNLVKATALNNSEEWCDPTTNSCSGLTGAWPTLTFGTDGANVQTVTDSLNQTTRYTFSSGDITGIRPPTSGSNTVTISYSSGKVSAVNVGGSSWGYAYSGSTTTITDPLSHARVVGFDAGLSAITSDTDALGRTTTYTYDGTNNLIQITADEGNNVQFGYDDRGNQLSVLFVPKSGSGLSNIVTSASYPTTCTYVATCNKPTSITDELGNVTDFTYNNTHGGVLTATSPAPSSGAVRPQTRFSYDTVYAWYKTSSGGSLQQGPATTVLVSTSACASTSSCSGGSDEVRTNISFASSNNLLPMSVQTGAGNGTLSATVAFTYNALGDRITTDGPLSGTSDTTKFRYDANRQLIGVIGPDPDGAGTTRKHPATRYTYNADGQATAVEQGTVNSQSDPDWASFASLAKNEYVYDSIGRVTRSNYIASSTTHAVTQYSYLANNLPECVAIRMNPSEFSSLPSSACTLDTAGSYGNDRITKYIYTNADQVYQVKSAFGTALEQTTATFTYTDNAQQATLADAKGNLTTFEYDGFDRMRKIRYPDASNGSVSSTTDYDYFVFDAASNITQWTRRGWASTGLYIDYSYDHLNRQTLANASTGDDITTTYDNLNRPLTQATSAQTLTFAYDALSRMTSAGGPLGTTSYQYDLAGNRTRMTWPDSFYVTYDVDLLGMVTAIRENGAASGVGVLAAYEYNDLGQRTSLKRGSSNDLLTTWSYDSARRLSTMTRALGGSGSDQTSGFTWNPAGQQVAQTVTNTGLVGQTPGGAASSYSSNGLNQYASVAGASFTYDARGNLTSDGVKTYGYDIYNRLTSASGGATFSYDPASRLYAPNNGATTTYLGYDGLDLVGEYSSASSSALTKRYVFGPGVDEPIVWYEGSGTSDRRFLIADERGSIATVANSSGTPLNNNTYNEFGVPDSGNAGRFQYTGQAWMPEAGLYNYKARAYAANFGRFGQSDPIGFGGGINFYAYVRNDPVNFIDPLGLQDVEVTITGLRCRNCNVPQGIDRFARVGMNVPGVVDGFSLTPGDAENEIVVTGKHWINGTNFTSHSWIKFSDFLQLLWEQGSWGVSFEFRGIVWASDGAKAAAKALDCGCLVAGTRVATPNGLRRIESLEVGDQVIAFDPESGKTSSQRVTGLIRPEPKIIWRLETRDASGNIETFDATDDHPWYIEKAGWIETRKLRSGQRIETADDRGLTILSVAPTDRVERSFNLSVEGPHTFLIGADGAVVHNNNKCKKLAQIAIDLFKKGDVEGAFSVFRRNPSTGKVDAYQTFTPNPRNPNGIQAGDRFRGAGGPHGGVDPPLIISPGGSARPATPTEIP